MNPLVGMVLLSLVILGAWFVGREAFEYVSAKRKAMPVAECKHEWAPWDEPKDCDVKSAEYGGAYGMTHIRDRNYVGKFQDRVCSKCNIYERRWA